CTREVGYSNYDYW
nr:immunoglobulin heavy chain junction region [Macaca mulatta]MOW90619.1 immunoglobulin heavy chain junction region [Macaca mulatta]MOW92394.1 immunoglobulin heavy chain junction region [Macaca mulatta]